jgi:uncharacterized protein
MTEHAGKPMALDPHGLDILEFARAGRQAVGEFRIDQLHRLAHEMPEGAPALPEYDPALRWQAEGGSTRELQADGSEVDEPYLRLAVHGAIWLACQRCLEPYRQPLDVDAEYRIVETDEEADERALNDDAFDVIVGSRRFDLVDLIEEELLLSLPLVPKHEVCPQIHESLVTGAAGERAHDPDREPEADDAVQDESERKNPFAALEALKRGGPGSGQAH